jgi:hypothetical protein
MRRHGAIPWVRAGLAAVLSIVAVLAVRAVAVELLGADGDAMPLGWGPPIIATVIGVTAAVAAYVLTAARSRRPVTRYRQIAVVALLLSFIPTLLLPESTGTRAALLSMHVVVAAIVVTALTWKVPDTAL